jgi:ankyrin repeat protein
MIFFQISLRCTAPKMDVLAFAAAIKTENNEEARRLCAGYEITPDLVALVVWYGNTALLRYLMQHRNAKFDSMALDAAVFGRHLECLRCLLSYDSSDAALAALPSKHNRSLLHRAALTGQTEMVSLLLRRGAQLHVNLPDETGSWPIHLCILGTQGHAVVNMIRCLVEEGGALVNAPDLDGDTPLHCAVYFNHVDAARLLLHEFAALPDLRNAKGLTPADLLTESNPCLPLFQSPLNVV